MAEGKGTAQAQHSDSWKKTVEEQTARFGSMQEELMTKAIEQTRTAIDEGARMMKESLAYASQLSAEWRRLTVEAACRGADLWSPRI